MAIFFILQQKYCKQENKQKPLRLSSIKQHNCCDDALVRKTFVRSQRFKKSSTRLRVRLKNLS